MESQHAGSVNSGQYPRMSSPVNLSTRTTLHTEDPSNVARRKHPPSAVRRTAWRVLTRPCGTADGVDSRGEIPFLPVRDGVCGASAPSLRAHLVSTASAVERGCEPPRTEAESIALPPKRRPARGARAHGQLPTAGVSLHTLRHDHRRVK